MEIPTFSKNYGVNTPIGRSLTNFFMTPLFGQNWNQQQAQPMQGTGAQNVTNAILGQPAMPKPGMGTAMGQMPMGRVGGGFGSRQPLSMPDDTRTHGGMNGGGGMGGMNGGSR